MEILAYLLISPIIWVLAVWVIWLLADQPPGKENSKAIAIVALFLVLAFWGIMILVNL